MNQKSIDGTLVMILRLEIMINVYLVKQLTNSVCFNHWSIDKLNQMIRRKITNTKFLIYSLVKIHLVQ